MEKTHNHIPSSTIYLSMTISSLKGNKRKRVMTLTLPLPPKAHNKAVHKAIDISQQRALPQGSENTTDVRLTGLAIVN